MTATIANESELYVAPGGATYRLMQRISVARNIKPSIARRIIILLLITWVPMCVFALLQGVAFGATPRESFLLDFATYARFLVGIPVLIIAEVIVGPWLTQAGLQFVRDDLVREEDYPAFEQAIARLARRRESVTAMIVIIALAAFGAWNLTVESVTGWEMVSGVGTVGWQSLTFPEGYAFRYNLAGIWSHFIALPVLLFLWYRWLWRILFWTLFLFDVSRLKLELVPTHADGAGGLSFLEIAHSFFGIFAFGVGTMFSAEAAFRIIYEGARPEVLQAPVLIILALMLVLFLGPMAVFTPVMARTKRAALISYGSLVARYNHAYHHKWIDSPGAQGEPLLGNSDIQSLADLGNSFRFISVMRYTPFGKWAVVELAFWTLVPALPLVLLVVPLGEIIAVLKKVAL